MAETTPAEIERARIAGWWAFIRDLPRETCPFDATNADLRAAWLGSFDGCHKRMNERANPPV